jgi:hypothetical protein
MDTFGGGSQEFEKVGGEPEAQEKAEAQVYDEQKDGEDDGRGRLGRGLDQADVGTDDNSEVH